MTRFLLLISCVLLVPTLAAQTITVSGNATLAVSNGAVLDLHSATLDFGTTGTLAETTGGRVAGGVLTATRTLNAPSAVDVAGLGATITSAQNLGATVVTRGHAPQQAGTVGIARYYDVAPANNANLNATLAFRYHDAELNGLAEADLKAWRSSDGGATYAALGGTLDAAANTLTLTGLGSFSRFTAAAQVVALLAAQAWLQGPYNAGAGQMNTALSAVLPATDPYTGTATVAPHFFTADPAGQQVVDWVLVRLLTGNPAAPPMTVAAEVPALLKKDGSIVATDGISALSLPVLAGSYYVVVRHRNHLPVMSSSAVALGAGTAAWDFRAAQAQAYGATPMKALAAGTFGLFAGDGNASGDIGAADRNSVWRAQNGLTGYRAGDYNLSGDVSATDRNALWRTNNGRAAQVPPAN